jgi:hypothetical protein
VEGPALSLSSVAFSCRSCSHSAFNLASSSRSWAICAACAASYGGGVTPAGGVTVTLSRTAASPAPLLMVYIRIKLQLDLQADKSSVIVKGPFFPQVCTQGIESVEQMCDAKINLIKPRTLIFKGESYASNLENIM